VLDELSAAADCNTTTGSPLAGRNNYGSGAATALLTAYYRCPPSHLASLLAPDTLQEFNGFFRFGEKPTCYGRLSTGIAAPRLGTDLENVLARVIVSDQEVRLPFAAEEIIDNLRRERYAAHFREQGKIRNELMRKAYYCLRPLLGVPVRRCLQKIHLRGWDQISFPDWPLDITVERIHQQLLALSLQAMKLERIPFIWFWPDHYSSCLVMTHDIEDHCGKAFCPALMDLDESAGLHSSFQVVPENRYSVSQAFLDHIRNRGFEVNVHDLKHDGRLYADRTEFLRRAKRINQYIKEFKAEGFRSGILYRNADWYDAFEVDYDMSIPNVAHLDPQRGGCCTIMPYFIGNIVELPLTCTQDYTLFQILGDYSINLWKKQIAGIRNNYGLISFIVHPDYIIEPDAQSTYKSLLEYLSYLRSDGSVWNALPRDVARWWRQRNEMELLYEDGRWRVEGPGKERARVAYATLAGDRVTYSFHE
jgi:hypothetical protein